MTDQASATAPAQRGGGSADSASEGRAPIRAAHCARGGRAARCPGDQDPADAPRRERRLLAFRSEGVLRIPADFVGDGHLLKGLPGLLTLLFDAGYTEDEGAPLALHRRRLAARDRPPVQALAENRGKEVHREGAGVRVLTRRLTQAGRGVAP